MLNGNCVGDRSWRWCSIKRNALVRSIRQNNVYKNFLMQWGKFLARFSNRYPVPHHWAFWFSINIGKGPSLSFGPFTSDQLRFAYFKNQLHQSTELDKISHFRLWSIFLLIENLRYLEDRLWSKSHDWNGIHQIVCIVSPTTQYY